MPDSLELMILPNFPEHKDSDFLTMQDVVLDAKSITSYDPSNEKEIILVIMSINSELKHVFPLTITE